MKKLLLSFLILFSSALFAEENNRSFQRSPGKVDCNEEVKICHYVSQNITAKELIAKLNMNLFPGSILSPSEGYIVADGLKKINFYINDTALMEKLIAAIPLMDTLEEFDPSDLVLLTTEIYSLSEVGLSNLQASLVSANDPASELAEWIITSALGGPTGMALKIGTNLLSSLLGSSKVKSESTKVTTISQLIPNLAGINYSNTSKVYISPPNSGVVKEEQSGLTVGGSVSVSSKDNDLVLIKDYNLTYGVIENVEVGERVNILSITNPQLYLVKGTSSLVVSSINTEERAKTEYSAVSFGRTRERLHNKVMVITRAEAVNFQDYVKEMRKLRSMELHKEFSKEERDLLPKTSISISQVLESVKPMAAFTTSGDRVIGFKLDPKNARVENIKKNIEVSVKSKIGFGKGLNQKVILTVENLMLTGMKFNPLSLKELKKTIVEIEVTLKVFGSDTSVTKKLIYNPETNSFIE